MRMRSAFHQAFDQGATFGLGIRAAERDRDIGLKEAEPAAAIVALADVAQCMEWRVTDHPGHGIGELDLTA